MVALLANSCAGRSPQIETPKPCAVAAWPNLPTIEEKAECADDAVCLTVASAVALGEWVRAVFRYHEDIATCPWVEETSAEAPGTEPETVSSGKVPNIQPIIDAATFPGMDVSLEWRKCGEVNGYYYPATKTIVMCKELTTRGDSFIRFVVAHEMGHAAIRQMHLAYTGSEEVAADEFGALILNLIGYTDDVMATGDYFFKRGYPEDPWDDHPGDVRRGLALQCFATGFKHRHEPYGPCTGEWARLVDSWRTLIGASYP